MSLFKKDEIDKRVQCKEIDEDGYRKLYCRIVIESPDGTLFKEIAVGKFYLDENGVFKVEELEGHPSAIEELKQFVLKNVKLNR